jgi:DNA (cytosine-5)-methyltransferase 1
MSSKNLPVISLFSGGLGLDLGLEQAGFQIRVAVECNKFAAETIRKNRPDIPVIERKLEKVTTREILQTAGLEPGEPVAVIGGPSCQTFSTAGQRGSISDPRGGMFKEFLRVVRETRSRFFVMENVHGVLSAAVKHRPLRKRGPGYSPLSPDEELGSAFKRILKELKETGYYVVFDLLNAADYGASQVRERVFFIGSRDREPVAMPRPTHAKVPTNGQAPWRTLRAGLKGLKDTKPVYEVFPPGKSRYLKHVPEGGNWRDLPKELQSKAMGGAYRSWGGRVGFFRRLAWDRPAPALTTRPVSKATMLCHPTKLRPLSVREYARLQQFPDTWKFAGGLPQKYKQIGNAVPVGLGKAIGESIRQAMRRRKKVARLGVIICANDDLLARLSKRPRTILNPPRMRKVQTQEALQKWLNGRGRYRVEILKYVAQNNGNGQGPGREKTQKSQQHTRHSCRTPTTSVRHC